jgi:hypothetical protein
LSSIQEIRESGVKIVIFGPGDKSCGQQAMGEPHQAADYAPVSTFRPPRVKSKPFRVGQKGSCR